MNDGRRSTKVEMCRITQALCPDLKNSSSKLVKVKNTASSNWDRKTVTDKNPILGTKLIESEDLKKPWVNYVSITAGIGAFVCLIIAAILTIVLSRRHSGSAYIWQLVWIILGACFALWVAIWINWFDWDIRQTSIELNIDLLFPVLMFLTALYFAGYLLVSTFWFIFYRQTHFDNLAGLRFLESDWSQTFGPRNLPEIIRSSSMVIWCIALLMVIAFFCYLFICGNFLQNKYQTVRYALYFTSVFMAISAWIVVYWAEECFEYEGFFDERPLVGRSTKTLKGVAITAVILSGLATAINLLRSKHAYIMLALVLALQLIVTVGATGMVWRLVRKAQVGELSYVNTLACTYTMQTMSEAEFHGQVCPYGSGKYLLDGQHPHKAFLTKRWERGNFDEIRSLNPACCLTAKYYYIWPFMQLGYWGLVLSVSCFTAFVFSLWLISTDDYPPVEGNKMIGVVDIAAGCLLIVLALVWCVHFFARKKNYFDRNFTFSQLKAYIEPAKYPLVDFTIVPQGVQNELNSKDNLDPTFYSNGTVCFNYDNLTLPYPTFLNDSKECSDPSQCSIRVAVASTNSKLISNGSVEGLNIISVDNKYNFFPDCVGNLTSYHMVSGPEEKVREFLRGLQVCTMDLKSIPTLGIYKDQVVVHSNVTGLKDTEMLWNDSDQKSSSECMLGFTKNTTLCNSSATCRYFSPLSRSAVFRTLKGHLFRFFRGEKIDLDNPYIVVYASSGKEMVGNGYASYVNGYFVIRNIPIFANASYLLTIEIKDPSGVFLNKTIDLLIFPNSESLLSMGDIQLVTKDGWVCDYNDFICKRNQPHLNCSLNLTVNDGSYHSVASRTLGTLSRASVALSKSFTYKRTPFITVETDSEGHATIPDLPYGSYTISVSKQGYTSYMQTIEIQDQYHEIESLILDTEEIQEDARLTGSLNSHNTDGDLVLQIRSDSGHECEVSPYFKFCGYAAHAKDSFPQTEEERIYIRRLSVATYNVFFLKAPPYNLTCSTCESILNGRLESHLYGFENPSQNIDWSSHNIGQNLTKSHPIPRYKDIPFGVRYNGHAQLGGVLNSQALFYHARKQLTNLMALISTDLFMEEALRILPIFNFLGIPLFGEQRFFVNTSYAQEDKARDGLVAKAPAPVVPIKVQEVINEMVLNQTGECNPYIGICLANQNCTNPPPLSSNCTETSSTYWIDSANASSLNMNYTMHYGITPVFVQHASSTVALLDGSMNTTNSTKSVDLKDNSLTLNVLKDIKYNASNRSNVSYETAFQHDSRNKSGRSSDITESKEKHSSQYYTDDMLSYRGLVFEINLSNQVNSALRIANREARMSLKISSISGLLPSDVFLDYPTNLAVPIVFADDYRQSFNSCNASFSFTDSNSEHWPNITQTSVISAFPGQPESNYSINVQRQYLDDPFDSNRCSVSYSQTQNDTSSLKYQYSTWQQRPVTVSISTANSSWYARREEPMVVQPLTLYRETFSVNTSVEHLNRGAYLDTLLDEMEVNNSLEYVPYYRQEKRVHYWNKSINDAGYFLHRYHTIDEVAANETAGEDVVISVHNLTSSSSNFTQLQISSKGFKVENSTYTKNDSIPWRTCEGCTTKYVGQVWNEYYMNQSRPEGVEPTQEVYQFGNRSYSCETSGHPGVTGTVKERNNSIYNERIDLRDGKKFTINSTYNRTIEGTVFHEEGTYTNETYFGWMNWTNIQTGYDFPNGATGEARRLYINSTIILRQCSNDVTSPYYFKMTTHYTNHTFVDYGMNSNVYSYELELTKKYSYDPVTQLVAYKTHELYIETQNPPLGPYASDSRYKIQNTYTSHFFKANPEMNENNYFNHTSITNVLEYTAQGVLTNNYTYNS